MFTVNTFKFLEELKQNNNKAWFELNKSRYEADLLSPSLDFIEKIGPELQKIAPEFEAVPRKAGGSLMRIYRDTRFAKDKSPYKTNIGIHIRHRQGKDVHSPGFYVHIAPESCFLGAGCWCPEPEVLALIRSGIAATPERWFSACAQSSGGGWQLSGEQLSRPPKGFAQDHPAIEDLKRKDFLLLLLQNQQDVLAPDFAHRAVRRFAEIVPFMKFLCQSLQTRY